jgi:hypothetical protein
LANEKRQLIAGPRLIGQGAAQSICSLHNSDSWKLKKPNSCSTFPETATNCRFQPMGSTPKAFKTGNFIEGKLPGYEAFTFK